MKCLLFSVVSAEIFLHGSLWYFFLASWKAAVWGLFMQILYVRLVSNFPKIEIRSPLFICVCGEACMCVCGSVMFLLLGSDSLMNLLNDILQLEQYFMRFFGSLNPFKTHRRKEAAKIAFAFT